MKKLFGNYCLLGGLIAILFACGENTSRPTTDSLQLDSLKNVSQIPGKADTISNFVNNFNTWFTENNQAFEEIRNTHYPELEEGGEWDGTVLEYEKFKDSIVDGAKEAMIKSDFFTNNFKEKRLKQLLDTTDHSIENLPTLLFDADMHITSFTFEKVDSVFDNGNKAIIKCNTTLAVASTYENFIYMKIVKEDNKWKINTIRYDLDFRE